MTKFKAQVWQLIIHVIMSGIELYGLYQTKNLLGRDLFFDPKTLGMLEEDNIPFLKTLYVVQMAIWVVTCIYHVFIAERQSDYLVMLGHHFITLYAIGGSYLYGFPRYGLVILFVHDISDIPIDLLKITNYLKLEGGKSFFAVELSFLSCLVSWGYFRLWYYPTQILYNGLWKTEQAWLAGANYMNFKFGEFPFNGYGDDALNLRLANAFVAVNEAKGIDPQGALNVILPGTLLCVGLGMMHFYWFYLLLKILIGIISNPDDKHDAGSQVYEGHSDDEEEEMVVSKESSVTKKKRTKKE